MPALDIPRNYEDGTVLLESDLDAIQQSLTTLINTTKLNGDNIQTGGIDASLKIIAASISTAKIADSAVTTAKIADSNVTTAKIADSNVTTAKMADSNVTTAKIANSAVTVDKIANNAVTKSKLSASVYNASAGDVSHSGSGNPALSGPNDVTSLSCSVTVSNTRPVIIVLQGTSVDTNNPSKIAYRSSYPSWTSLRSNFFVSLYRNGSYIYSVSLEGVAGIGTGGKYSAIIVPPGMFMHIDNPGSGTHTYQVKIDNGNATETLMITTCKLIAVEL